MTTPTRFFIQELIFAGLDETHQCIVLRSPVGISLRLTFEQADWHPSIIIATLMVPDINFAITTSGAIRIETEGRKIVARIRIAKDHVLPEDPSAKARHVLGLMAARLEPKPLILTHGTEDEMRAVMNDIASVSGKRIDIWSRTGEEDSAVSLFAHDKRVQDSAERILKWFDPVGSKMVIEDQWVDQREALGIASFRPGDEISAHDRVAAAERLRAFLESHQMALEWSDADLDRALMDFGLK